ncbi:MAG: hypothetical protein LBD51_03335, partial [Bifidobacteriaceae bacterium]|nr:hypothetical protein [Bifidobacteriaceae bacterium]
AAAGIARERFSAALQLLVGARSAPRNQGRVWLKAATARSAVAAVERVEPRRPRNAQDRARLLELLEAALAASADGDQAADAASDKEVV